MRVFEIINNIFTVHKVYDPLLYRIPPSVVGQYNIIRYANGIFLLPLLKQRRGCTRL